MENPAHAEYNGWLPVILKDKLGVVTPLNKNKQGKPQLGRKLLTQPFQRMCRGGL